MKKKSIEKKSGKQRMMGTLDSVARAMELPPGTLGKSAQITLLSNREAVIDGCKGVLEYDDTIVRINTGESVIRFTGRSLAIKSLTNDQAVLKGFILSIDFSS